MKKYLTEDEYLSFQQRLARGEARLTIARRVARQFFTHVENASIRSITGRSMALQKLVIRVGIALPYVLLLLCIGAIIMYFGWFAALGVPLAGMFWTVIAGLTGDKGTWAHGTVGLVVGLGLAAVIDVIYAIPVTLCVISLWLHRMTYILAQLWITRLVSNSFAAYDMLVEHIDIEDPVFADEDAEYST